MTKECKIVINFVAIENDEIISNSFAYKILGYSKEDIEEWFLSTVEREIDDLVYPEAANMKLSKKTEELK